MNETILAVAVAAARAAGEVMRRGRVEGFATERKGAADVTTEVDRAAEREIVRRVRSRFPDHGILGEEGAAHATDAAWRWVIDPLDGTKNYAHGSDRCAVSIAVERDGEAVVGVVYAPFAGSLFVATRGGGARCDDVAIAVSRVAELRAAMVTTALTYDGAAADAAQLARIARIFAEVQALRSLGCAAVDLCDVARGRLDAFFEPGLQPWDTAAGALIVREAGGVVTDFAGARHAPATPTLIASNGLVHDALRARVSP